MPDNKGKEALMNLGFTGLEADIYTFLLSEPPSTGYRISQATGKPVANTYKAIESLYQKGMILVEEGESRFCRAVPLKEVLSRLERDHKNRLRDAETVLENLERAEDDERIYHIDSREQVFERLRSMLERAGEVVMLDLFPLMFEEFRGDIERTVSRGVEVNLIAYEDVKIKGVNVMVDPRGHGVYERWPVQVIDVVIDAREQLLSYLSIDGAKVHEAIWSTNIYLSWLQHISIISEFSLLGIERALDEGGSKEKLREMLRKYRSPGSLEAPGYRIIQKRFTERM